MKLNEEGKTNFRKHLFQSIAEISNLKLQKLMWLDPENTNPHWSYVEFACCYFDDLLNGEEPSVLEQAGVISSDELSLLREFHEAFDSYKPPNGDEYDSDAILQDPNWQSVVSAALKLKSDLLELDLGAEDKANLKEYDHLESAVISVIS